MTVGFLAALTLSACNSSEVSLSEVKTAPKSIEEETNDAADLQLIQGDKNTEGYLIYQTSQLLSANLEQREDVITIKLTETKSENTIKKPFIYKLTWDSPDSTLKVLINGKETPFDVIKGQ